jgi:6-phosphogluconolactonase/glucosamine-6-phosphate isomerase/deaminase
MPHRRGSQHMIRTFSNPKAVSRAAADLFVELAEAAFAARGRFHVTLTGDYTPLRTYHRCWRRRNAGSRRCVSARSRSRARQP